MHGRMKWWVGVVAAAALVDSASAGTLYTTYAESRDDLASMLSVVKPESGDVSEIGTTATPLIAGLTWDPSTDSLYGIGHDENVLFGELVRVDPLSGSTVALGETGIRQPTAMTWAPTLNRFVVTSSGPTGSSFYAVDYDGTAEVIGHVNFIILGMTWDPFGDRILFTTLSSFGGDTGLGEYDIETGSAFVFGSNGAHLQGIALDPDSGILYGLPDLTDTPGGGGDTLFTVDLETGEATPIATLREEFYASLAVIPIPTPGAGLVVLLPLLAATRRR